MLEEIDRMLDLGELVRRAVKYLVEGFLIAVVAYAIPKRTLSMDEIALITLSIGSILIIGDVYLPSIASTARQGMGLGLGMNMVGFPGNTLVM